MKKSRILVIVLLLILACYLGYKYVYKDHRDIASEKESFLVAASAIYQEFKSDEKKATAKYLDKTISVSGKISAIDLNENTLIVDGKLVAIFIDKIPSTLKEQSEVKLKGRFIGYDDLLEELKMDQCFLE